jgi:TetR/AcrR family transcriptional regulator, regulator of autoinduction and epiphytic fitness
MRTTKAQQDKNRRRIIQAAVDLMTEHGFEGTTMKQIARAADIGDATIYKYFPTKEKLVTAYFEQAIADALAHADKAPWSKDFTLHESMQLLIDSLLEILLADREFVGLARGLVERAPMLLLGDDLPGKPLLKKAFLQLLDKAEASKEIVPCGFKASLASLLADYVYGVMAYWLRDKSDQFANTTQMVDLSLGVLVLALRSGLVDKLLELGGFMVRSQMARLMHDGTGIIDLLQLARRGLGGQGGAGGGRV